jgi:hypothetical protein
MAQASTFTDSALSDKVKEFLTRFKDRNGKDDAKECKIHYRRLQ